jgi:pimeloyl-ACP methyl ester carboxylesterase
MVDKGGVTIHYETWGRGPALLLLAPGGLRASRIESWANAPWNPIEALANRYFVVAMDQRNTGPSVAPISGTDGWSAYADDQLAVMDELGVDQFGVLGMCIGGAFIMALVAGAPQRVRAAVALQPVGRSGGNRDEFRTLFEQWRADIAPAHPEATDGDWEGMWSNLFGADHTLWSVPDSFLPTVTTPLLVLQGDDVYHPREASRLLAATVPGAALVEHWKDPAHQADARAAIDTFLARHLA